MTLTERDLLTAGGSRRADQPGAPASAGHPRWRTWAPRLALPVAAIVVVAAAVWELQPWAGPPPTGIKLLVDDAGALAWLDVDTGVRTAVETDPGADIVEPTIVGDGVVVRYAIGDPLLADRVVGYRDDGGPHEIGEADHVVPATGSALWLVVDGDAGNDGGVALTTAFGDWRSRVFATPPGMDVVGATDDGLLVERGVFRYRRLQLWDVQLGEPIRNFGLVVGVTEVRDTRAMVTTGCLTSGCNSAVFDLPTGRSTDVMTPLGYTPSGTPILTADGVARVVSDASGTPALAVGAPDDLEVLSIEGFEPARGSQPLSASGGWLVVPTDTAGVTLWREGADPEDLPTVSLGATEQVIGVRG